MSTIFVTMVYNDPIFLDIWVRYYSKHTDRANLHIITHGPGQDYAHEMGEGCKILECPRDPLNPRLDQDRFAFINEYCSELVKSHDRVIYNDVDEIVVLDPDYDGNLVEYIEAIDPAVRVITPLGLEIVHRKYLENDYDYSRALFTQRRFIRMNGWYTKPCITNTEITWGPDGHGCSHDELYLDDNLYLFHLKWFDDQFHIQRHKERLELRFKDEDGEEVIVGAGSWSWSEMTYQLVTNSFLRHGDDKHKKGFDFSRHRDRVVNSFQGNEKGMYKIDWFVDGDFRLLPERFVGVI
jgi:hypothetical protein